jgi:DNA invertase Pin-like site-specific DNA recombinase
LQANAASWIAANALLFFIRDTLLVKTRRKNLKLEQRIDLGRRFAKGETASAQSAAFGIFTRQVNRIANEQRGEGLAGA